MTTLTPYRPPAPAGRDGFGQVLHAEWTKFHTVRGWIVGILVAIIVTAGLGVLVAKTSGQGSCTASTSSGTGAGQSQSVPCGGGPSYALGPGGEPVNDQFYFVRQPLAGNGSLTVRVTSLTPPPPAQPGQNGSGRSILAPWAKAGIIIKDGTTQGSAYAAMMTTGSNGVRMQWNYTGDTPGLPGAVSAASPRWLRLTRDGDTITGYDSSDGTHWTQVGTVTLSGLPATVQAGMFATSPVYSQYSSSLGTGNTYNSPTQVTGTFDDLSRTGDWPASAWTGQYIIGPGEMGTDGNGYHQAAGQFTVTGSGDIGPLPGGPGIAEGGPDITLRDYLYGTFAGLIAIAVVAAMFMTAEYRRGLIRTTLTASPSRGRVLAAKAIVIGSVAFVAGLVAAAVAVLVGKRVSRIGSMLYPTGSPTELRMIVGTAAAVALIAVLTLAVATIVRRSATAILIVILTVVIPTVLSIPPGIPSAVTEWLLRVTPAAGLAVQQAVPQYYQVQSNYIPSTGFFPLAPWTGFAVLCGWTVLALALAFYLLRRRDA